MGAKRKLRYENHPCRVRTTSVCKHSRLQRKSPTLQMTPERFKPPIPLTPTSSSWIGRLRNRQISQITEEKNKKALIKQDCNTSDYGTASESSRKSSLIVSTDEGCSSWDQFSGISSLPGTPLQSEVEETEDQSLSATCWSDSEAETKGTSDNHNWDNCHDDEDTEGRLLFKCLGDNSVGIKLLHSSNVIVLVPDCHITGSSNYKLQINSSPSYKPNALLGTIHASHVVSLEPHGAQFLVSYPAVIFLPLQIEPGPTDSVECLYSNTTLGARPQWEKLPAERFYYRMGMVVISTWHFSLFTVVIRSRPLESRRLIRQRSGGRLRNTAAPGVEIDFPRGSLQEDIFASVQVLFEDDPTESRALASPIVMVGPHGYQFAAERPPVTVRLPLPDYLVIRDRFPTQLSVWQSNTSENEAVFWERLDVDVRVERDPISRCYTACFPVYHFSFFKIMWDILSASLFEAKMGMSHFYPYISFSMQCQAFMEENADSSRFGLEVICHRSDRRLPELTNYKHRVGASLKPKLIKPGKIWVRLKSQLFEADVEAGEDPEMLKEECDFRGRDFEKQYACRFKTGVVVGRGTFGKVTVERSVAGGLEAIFEFNLHKTGNENEATMPDCSDRWSIVAIKELAGTLRILEDQNWKSLARYIGFTRQEIKVKLQYSADPFLSMMNMYQARSGSPEEFLQALYAVSRDLQISGSAAASNSPRGGGAGGSQSGSSLGGSSPTGSHNSSQSSSTSPLHAMRKGLWSSLSPWRVNKDEDSDTSGTQCTRESAPTRKRSNPSATVSASSSKGKALKDQHSGGSGSTNKRPRRQYSDCAETVTTASEEDDDSEEANQDIKEQEKDISRNKRRVVVANRKKVGTALPVVQNNDSEDERSTEKCKRDPRMMTDGDLWRVSASMNNINWRALGRTLGLQESALVNIESSYRTAGCRECAYQVLLEWKGLKPKQCTVGFLYSALTKENMNEVAKQIAANTFGDDES